MNGEATDCRGRIVVISADGNVALKAAALGGESLSKPVRLETMLGVLDRLCN